MGYDIDMISIIKGKVLDIGTKSAVLDVNGIGYEIYMMATDIESLEKSKEYTVWTHFVVREDSQSLYGFLEKKDRDFFQLLITVSGIGPKTALNIMSVVDADTIIKAVRDESSVHLVKVGGLGKKTADKIVMELRDKVDAFGTTNVYNAGTHSDADAIEALKALGYSANEAREALKKVNKDVENTSEKIKLALKNLG